MRLIGQDGLPLYYLLVSSHSPVGFAEGGYGSNVPVISASHVGRGKMLGYGHESWVDGHGGQETEFSLRAVEWACGENANVGLAYGAGFDDFEEELNAQGHNVHLSVSPSDLSGLDCLLDEFWNGHDDQDNQALVDFMLNGGGLIMGVMLGIGLTQIQV